MRRLASYGRPAAVAEFDQSEYRLWWCARCRAYYVRTPEWSGYSLHHDVQREPARWCAFRAFIVTEGSVLAAWLLGGYHAVVALGHRNT